MATDYLQITDLYALVGQARVVQFFDDDGDGVLSSGELQVVDFTLRQAEAQLYSKMLRAWSKPQVILLANNDTVFKAHAAWVALELASERRTEFSTIEGKGLYYLQYDRAVQYADDLSKNKLKGVADSVPGVGAPGSRGGATTPQPTIDTPTYTFAPSKDSPSGHGGF